MKKIVLSSLALALASCSSTPLEKASLEYKVFPKIANFKYEFNLAIPQVVDARNSNFVLDNDEYFAQPVTKSLSNILFEEIRSTNAFETVVLLNQSIDFNPTSTEIQNVKRTVGKDAIMLAQINKFNANVRKLSDQDTSNFVNLKVFTNITYKLVLTDSETVIFLTTKDTSSDKVVPLDENVYKAINELAIENLKENIVEAKNDFILTTKGTTKGDYRNAAAKKEVTLEVEKEFDRTKRDAEEAKVATEQAEQEQPVQQPAEQAETQEQPAVQEPAKQQEEPQATATTQEPTTQTAEQQPTEATAQEASQPTAPEEVKTETAEATTTPEVETKEVKVETKAVETSAEVSNEVAQVETPVSAPEATTTTPTTQVSE